MLAAAALAPEAQAVIAAATQGAVTEPLLLYMPMIVFNPTGDRVVDKLSGRRAVLLPSAQSALPKLAVEDNSGDFRLWVGADGRVREAALLRAGSRPSGHWPKVVLAATPPPRSPHGSPDFDRVERYSMTSDFVQNTVSRFRQRSAKRKLVRLYLTAPPKEVAAR